MTSRPESVALGGRTLRVVAGASLPADPATLAVALAIRVLERFPALDAVVLATPGGEERLTRSEVDGLLAPDGLAGLQERKQWPRILARAVQRRLRSSGTDREGRADAPAAVPG